MAVLLALLSARVCQLRTPSRTRRWLKPWRARVLLVLLPLDALAIAGLLYGLALVWWYVVLAFLWNFSSVLEAVRWEPLKSVVGGSLYLGLCVLLVFLPTYGASVLYCHAAVVTVKQAALPQWLSRLVTTLVLTCLVLAFTWIGTDYVPVVGSYEPEVSKRFVSPSGQHTLVLEVRTWFLDDPSNHTYIESGLLRKELPDPFRTAVGGFFSNDTALKLQWSADEKQIDWQSWNEHGHLQW